MSTLKPLSEPFTRVITHRGAQIRKARTEDGFPDHVKFVIHPENTMASFEESLNRGHDIELDVNTNGADSFKRDGKVVEHDGKPIPFLPIFHDDHLGTVPAMGHLNGKGNPFKASNVLQSSQWLRYLPTKVIQNAKLDVEGFAERILYKVGNSEETNPNNPKKIAVLDTSEKASHIPTLDEVFTLLKQYPKRKAFVELKTLTLGKDEDFKGLAEKVVNLIQRMGVEKQVTVLGFNRYILEEVNAHAKQKGLKHLQLAYDIEPDSYLNAPRTLPETLEWAKKYVHTVLPWYKEVTKEFVDSAHKLGLKVVPYPWPEGREEERKEIKRAFENGVDAVVCNTPSDAEEILNHYKKKV
jgi:glycerophosphoryl diester phosphodiesterase